MQTLDQNEELQALENNEIYLEMGADYQQPSIVEVIYTGEYRDTSEYKLWLIARWLDVIAPQLTESEKEELFGMEAQFSENGIDYWIPIQKPLIPFLQAEHEPGNEVKLFIVWIGASRPVYTDMVEYTFLVNDFE